MVSYNFSFISNNLKSLIEPATQVCHQFYDSLGFSSYENAFIAPYYQWDQSIGCVIKADGNTIYDSECSEWKENAAFYDLTKAKHQSNRVVFLGFLLTVFGHSFTDNLRKLWFLKTDICKQLLKEGVGLVYTTSWNDPLPQHCLEFIRLAGIDFSKAQHITDLTQFDEVIIPDNCFRASGLGRMYCQAYTDLIDCIKSNIPPTHDSEEKIYFTRSSFSVSSMNETGEKALERVFRKIGYSIIVPERLSIINQIQLVMNCRFFAATEGSVAHLSMFCKPGTNLVIINKANYLNFHQVLINEFADLNVTYIEAHHSSKTDPIHPWWGPFYLCITPFLKKYVQSPIPHLPYWLKFSYWEYKYGFILRRCYNKFLRIFHNNFAIGGHNAII